MLKVNNKDTRKTHYAPVFLLLTAALTQPIIGWVVTVIKGTSTDIWKTVYQKVLFMW